MVASSLSMHAWEGIDSAVGAMVAAEHTTGGSIVTTPLMYPSGGSVVVNVARVSHDTFFITDLGLGCSEAELMGGTPRQFRPYADRIASEAGICFDSHAFFAVKASLDQLSGAIKIVANCSLAAVQFVGFKLAEKRETESGIVLHERLTRLFGASSVKRNARVSGSSSHSWQVQAQIIIGSRTTLIETASNHHASIVNVAVKFQDIARLESPPKRITVVASKESIGDLLGVLSQSSSVVEESIADERFEELVAA